MTLEALRWGTVTRLDTLLAERPDLDLDTLVETANEVLADHLPREVADGRVKSEVNPRLVRHYASEGLLDPPLRRGRHARYTVDHLLQLLALRRLLSEGMPTSTIRDRLRHKPREELRALVEQGADFTLQASGTDALEYLDAIRRRSASTTTSAATPPKAESEASSPPPRPPATRDPHDPHPTAWERYPLADGVELHVRSDVKTPRTPAAQRALLERITRLLIQIAQRRMP